MLNIVANGKPNGGVQPDTFYYLTRIPKESIKLCNCVADQRLYFAS